MKWEEMFKKALEKNSIHDIECFIGEGREKGFIKNYLQDGLRRSPLVALANININPETEKIKADHKIIQKIAQKIGLTFEETLKFTFEWDQGQIDIKNLLKEAEKALNKRIIQKEESQNYFLY